MNNLKVGSLFTDKKGSMYIVSDLINYKYRQQNLNKVLYYPIGDSGLINKTKAYTCKFNDIGTKYTLLNWTF